VARQRKQKLFPIAVSVQLLSESLGLRNVRIVSDAIKRGDLPAYQTPSGIRRQRVLTVDAVEWIRNFWPPVQPKKEDPNE
jgi:hypothetical protein